MAQAAHPRGKPGRAVPYWSQVLRALRDARGITQDGWGAHLGYSRATVRRWESGHLVPSADAEREIIALCRKKRLFRKFHEGPLLGVHVTPEWVADMLAMARLQLEDLPVRSGTSQQQQPIAIPPVLYAANGEVSLAYQVFGNGKHTFVITPGTISHRELDWENPGMRAFLLHLAESGKVIIYDKRATGLSDRVSKGSIKDRINDLRAVMDAANCETATLVGFTEGGPISIKFAVTWPHRVNALVLYGTSAQVPNISPEIDAKSLDHLQRVWGTTESSFLEKFAPSVNFNQQEQEWWARFQRMGASPGAVRDLNAMNATLDVKSLLPDIRARTLVIHRTGDLVTPFEQAVEMKQLIPDAQLVALEGEDHLAWAGDPREISGAILDFAATLEPSPGAQTLLTTMVCFGGDLAVYDSLRNLVRGKASSSPDHEFYLTDSGTILTMKSPTDAIQFVTELLQGIADASIDVGIGIHTGEVIRSQHALEGAAVRTCISMAEQATAGTALVSETVIQLSSDPRLSDIPTPLARKIDELQLFHLEPPGL